VVIIARLLALHVQHSHASLNHLLININALFIEDLSKDSVVLVSANTFHCYLIVDRDKAPFSELIKVYFLSVKLARLIVLVTEVGRGISVPTVLDPSQARQCIRSEFVRSCLTGQGE